MCWPVPASIRMGMDRNYSLPPLYAERAGHEAYAVARVSSARCMAFAIPHNIRQPYPELGTRMLTAQDIEVIQARIAELHVEHRDLDLVIETLSSTAGRDELQLRRLKKRKLQLKDTITLLQMRLIPDIPA